MTNKKYKGIYKDSNNTYYVSTTFITKDGFEIRKCKRGFKTQKEAENWKVEQRVYYSKIKYEKEVQLKTPLEKAVEKYFKYIKLRLKPTTYDNKVAVINKYVLKHFKDEQLNEISPGSIQSFYEFVCNLSVKPITKNHIIGETIAFIEWLDIMELVEPTVVRRFKRIMVKLTNTESSNNDYLTQDELKQLIDSIDLQKDYGKENRVFYALGGYAGLRFGEILGLQFKDIDFNNDTIRVYKQMQFINGERHLTNYTKTNQNKIVDIPHELSEWILELMQVSNLTDEDFVITRSRTAIRESLNADLENAKLRHIRVHDLRHSYCTMLYDLGADELYVAKQMGHCSADTSKKTYEHLTEDRKDKNKTKVIDSLMN